MHNASEKSDTLMLGASPRDFSSVVLFKTTNKLSINDIIVYQMSSFVYLWIHNELPAVFKNVFCRRVYDMHVYLLQETQIS